jgi:hypothetical protein
MAWQLQAARENNNSILRAGCGVLALAGYTATTMADPEIALDELALYLKPLNMPELQMEADAWLELLRDKGKQISDCSIAVKKQNVRVEIVEGVAKLAEDDQRCGRKS